jgi:hypothetical protein
MVAWRREMQHCMSYARNLAKAIRRFEIPIHRGNAVKAQSGADFRPSVQAQQAVMRL